MSATVEEDCATFSTLEEDGDPGTESGMTFALEVGMTEEDDNVFVAVESGPGTVAGVTEEEKAGVTFALEAGVTDEDDNSATFHTSEEFSSVQATKAITAPAIPQAKTAFIKNFFINIPRSKIFNLSVNIYFFKSATNFLFSINKKEPVSGFLFNV